MDVSAKMWLVNRMLVKFISSRHVRRSFLLCIYVFVCDSETMKYTLAKHEFNIHDHVSALGCSSIFEMNEE